MSGRDIWRDPSAARERLYAPSAAQDQRKPFCEGGTGVCEACVGSCGVEEEIERLRDGRDKAVALLMADPDRSAVAAVEGLRKLLPELLAEDVEQARAILDWIGVAGDDLSLGERVRILALELATKQGYSLDEAERLCPPAEASRV